MSGLRTFFSTLSIRARVAFGVGLTLILGFVCLATWFTLRADYAALGGELRPADAAEITAALSRWAVPYRFDQDGKTLLVPAERVYETRMRLAAEGVPKGGSGGFEMFKDSDYGVTEFAQRVNYQRALQGELERTISTLGEVQSVRVHLTLHRSGLFDADSESAKGAVTVGLRPGHTLGARQVVGIQRLVASAVEGLAPTAVTVLDQTGGVLSTQKDATEGVSLDERWNETARIEGVLRQRVADLVRRALQRDDFTVSVSILLNYDRVKRLQERLLAQGSGTAGMLVRERVEASPPEAADGTPHSKSVAPGREAEYAHGREQEEIVEATGRIQRISIGIIIPSVLPGSEQTKLMQAIMGGVGLDPARGDRLDIAAMEPVQGPVSSQAPAEAGRAARSDVPVLEPRSKGLTVPTVVWASLGTAIAAVVAALFYGLRRRDIPQRLTGPERQAALEKLQRWLSVTENAS
jgi:flagellar M-ring protein FliF